MIKNFGEYSVKNIKSFQGREGYGFNATLYRAGKKVAFCIDSGNGGEVTVDWNDGWNGEEARLLKAHVESLPSVQYYGHTLPIDEGLFVSDLVTKTFEDNRMKKQCKNKTLFRLSTDREDEYRYIATPFSPTIKAELQKRHGEQLVEIINERF